MKTKLLLSSALALCAAPALADISADDVWANTVAFYESSGGTVTAQQERDGSQLFLNDMVLTYVLPQGFGTLTIALPPTTLVEQEDGTVSLIMPKSMVLTIGFNSPEMQIDDLSASFAITQENFESTASGTPGDVTYTTTSGAYTVELEFEVAERNSNDIGLHYVGKVTGDGFANTTQVTEGDMIAVTAENTVLPLTVTYDMTEQDDTHAVGKNEYAETRAVTRYALPATGVTLANLAPALRDGAFIEIETVAGPASSENTIDFSGSVLSRDGSSTGKSEANMSISQEGLVFSGLFEDASTFFDSREMGFSAAIDVARSEVHVMLPLLASESPQNFSVLSKLEQLTLGDGVWGMFDPAGAIPRDPADLTIDVAGQMTSTVDFVDFAGLESAFSGETSPVTLNGLTINALDLALAGVSATGTGAITFAGTDMSSFEGLRPDGSARVEITGANTLLDTLVTAGFLPESQAGMTRMMMGMFTRVTGEDQVTSEVEVSEDGQVRVNGERVR